MLSGCPSVRPYECNSAAETARTSVNFDTDDFYENLSKNFRFVEKWSNSLSTFREDLTMLLLPAIANSQKSALLDYNGIWLLE
jgi:hypothetical protein